MAQSTEYWAELVLKGDVASKSSNAQITYTLAFNPNRKFHVNTFFFPHTIKVSVLIPLLKKENGKGLRINALAALMAAAQQEEGAIRVVSPTKYKSHKSW
jgi:hypothetical protein